MRTVTIECRRDGGDWGILNAFKQWNAIATGKDDYEALLTHARVVAADWERYFVGRSEAYYEVRAVDTDHSQTVRQDYHQHLPINEVMAP